MMTRCQMNKHFLRCWCLLILVFVCPALSQAARPKEKVRTSVTAQKPVVLKTARTVPARMAIAAKAARPAGRKSSGLLARRDAAGRGGSLKVAAQPSLQPAALFRPEMDASFIPGSNPTPSPRRPIVQRMYAAEGDMFYFNGRKYRIEGVPGPLARQEVTKQRLQQMLDSGDVSIEPRGLDDGGLTMAVIRVAGKDVADALK